MREHRVHRVFAHEPVGDRIGRIGARAHVLHVQRPAACVHVLDDTAQQSLVPIRVVGLEVVLPPHLAFDFRPGHRERVGDRPSGAGRIGVEHERAVDTEPGGKALAIGIRAIEPNTAPIIRDRILEEACLGQIVLVVDPLQPELALQGGFQLHDFPRGIRTDAPPPGLNVKGLSEGCKARGK